MNEFMQRPSRPTSAATAKEATASESTKGKSKSFSFKNGQHVGVGLLLFSGAIIAFALLALLLLNKTDVQREQDRIIEATTQAVFLDDANGQVYFGDLKVEDEDTYVLTDIYYVQVQTAIQPETGQQQASGISLAKLGNELHGPTDAMYINKDHVLFWENLKTSGQVVCAIIDYKTDELGEEGLTKDPECDERDNNTSQQQQQPATTDTGAQATQPAGTPQVDDTPAEDPAVVPAP